MRYAMRIRKMPQDAAAGAGPSSPASQGCHGAAPTGLRAREAVRWEQFSLVGEAP